jgi:superfamily I DNA and/or RNA helicase
MPTWHTTQDALRAAKKPSYTVALAKDARPNEGAKHYAWFSSHQAMTDHIQSTFNDDPSNCHFHELWLDTNYSSLVFFDLDRERDSQTNFLPELDLVLTLFISLLQAFLKEVYKIDIPLVIGDTVQVAFTDSKDKISAHLRANIKCENIFVMQHLAKNLEKYIYAKSAGIRDPPLCFVKGKANKLSTVIDTQIYRNFGSLRTRWIPSQGTAYSRSRTRLNISLDWISKPSNPPLLDFNPVP